jgi:DNA primase
VKAGLVADRDGRLSDRFWNRLMIPICRESGLVVGFGGGRWRPIRSRST